MKRLICALMCVVLCGVWGPQAEILCPPDSYRKAGDCEVRNAILPMDVGYAKTDTFNISDADVENLGEKETIDETIDKTSQIYPQLFKISQQAGMICCTEDDIWFVLARINDCPRNNKKLYLFELKYGGDLCRNMVCRIGSIDDYSFYITLLGVSNAVKCTPPIPGLKLKIQQQEAAIALQDLNDSQATICLRTIVRILGPDCPVTILPDLEDMPMQIYMKVLGLSGHDYQNLTLAKIIDALKCNKTMLDNLAKALKKPAIQKQPTLQQNSPNSTINPDPNIASGPRATGSQLISKAQKSSSSSSSSTSPAPVPEQLTQEYKSEYEIKDGTIKVSGLKMMLKIQFDCKGQIMYTITGADLRDLVDYKNSIPLLFFPCDIIGMVLYKRDQANGTWTLHGNYVFRTKDFAKTEKINVYALILAAFEWGNREIEPKHPNKQSKTNSFAQHFNDIMPFYTPPEEMTLMH